MKLYPRGDQTSVSYGDETYEVEDGAVTVPDELGNLLNSVGGDGLVWETEGQHSTRMLVEETERRNSPAALYDLLASINSEKAPVSADRLKDIRAAQAELAAEADRLEADERTAAEAKAKFVEAAAKQAAEAQALKKAEKAEADRLEAEKKSAADAKAAGTLPPDPEEGQKPDYESLHKPELEALCKERDLEVTGTKADLIARLVEADAKTDAENPGTPSA